ncbi:MAG: DUF3108 domain-containing protein [Telluria sp.]
MRFPLLVGATLLLHYLAFGWVGGRIGLPVPEQQVREPAPIVATLRAPPAPRVLAKPAAPPPARRPQVQRARPLPPVAVPISDAPVIAPAPLAEVPAPALQELVDIAPAQPEPAAAEAPAAPLPRQYKASVPPSSRLTLELERTDAKGTLWHGVADLSWQLDGSRYTMKFEAGISMLVTRVNLLALASEGAVGEAGFAPQVATEKRRGKAQTATHFNRDQGKITFSASQDSFPLDAGAQDKATLPLQLAAIARADPAQFDGGIEITVGEERRAGIYRFTVVGQEEIETGLGKLATWHLMRPPKPGSYNSRLDVWLAPEQGWYPVRIRNTEANGAVTTQTVTQIEVTDSGPAHAQ